MDSVNEIKTRLPIEELVSQYCQLQKKGKGFMCLCPFHKDTRPSLTVSPDKGIAYCFACQTGGDIFSFYQAIEGVDFRQALKDLAEKTGVKLEGVGTEPTVKKDEKERARTCLETSLRYFADQLKQSQKATEYLHGREITQDMIEMFGLGYAPDSFSETYQHLLKKEFSRKEILAAGLGVQKDLKEERIYDRFRNRIMFPIHDHRGDIVGFGGRTIGEDDAKYINSSEGPLYNKSTVLYGLHFAKESVRETKRIILVEGYFDVLACHRIGIRNVLAVSGTALTEQHVKILKRYAETIILCLDQDRAGRDAAERAYCLCSKEGLQVHAVALPHKDPDEAARADPDLLRQLLQEGEVPYMDIVLGEIQALDLNSVQGKREGLQRLLPLIDSITVSVEKEHEMSRAAAVLGTTETAFAEDLDRFRQSVLIGVPSDERKTQERKPGGVSVFSRLEVVLGLFLLYPHVREYLQEMIVPEEGFELALYDALKEAPEGKVITLEMLDLSAEYRERAAILQLYCEHHEFSGWSESLALREIRHGIEMANRDALRKKQHILSKKLFDAHREGKTAEAQRLTTQYQQILKLAKMATSKGK